MSGQALFYEGSRRKEDEGDLGYVGAQRERHVGKMETVFSCA